MTLRVMLVTGSFPPMSCGVGDYSEKLARSLAARSGVQVAVLTDEGAAVREPDEPYRVYPVMRRWRRRELGDVLAAIRDFRADVVHFQYPTLGYRGRLPWLLPACLSVRRIARVQTWHEYFPVAERAGWRDLALALPPGDVIAVRPDYLRHMPRWYRSLLTHRRFEFVPNASAIPRVSLTAGERREIRSKWVPPERALLVFFGFFYEHKGIDDLIEAMDPERQHLLLLGQPRPEDPYQARLFERVAREPLSRSVSTLGFRPAAEVARILAAADAVVLPFRRGGGVWNTSIHAATRQGTFTLTTSREQRGYDPERNVFHAEPGNVEEIRAALLRYAGRRRETPVAQEVTWREIAERHLAIYRRSAPSRSAPAATGG